MCADESFPWREATISLFTTTYIPAGSFRDYYECLDVAESAIRYLYDTLLLENGSIHFQGLPHDLRTYQKNVSLLHRRHISVPNNMRQFANCFETEEAIKIDDVRKLQLCVDSEFYKLDKDIARTGVELTGTLFMSIAGHYHDEAHFEVAK